MDEKIESKTEKGDLLIQRSGTEGIKLTIKVPNKVRVSIVVDKSELIEALELNTQEKKT